MKRLLVQQGRNATGTGGSGNCRRAPGQAVTQRSCKNFSTNAAAVAEVHAEASTVTASSSVLGNTTTSSGCTSNNSVTLPSGKVINVPRKIPQPTQNPNVKASAASLKQKVAENAKQALQQKVAQRYAIGDTGMATVLEKQVVQEQGRGSPGGQVESCIHAEAGGAALGGAAEINRNVREDGKINTTTSTASASAVEKTVEELEAEQKYKETAMKMRRIKSLFSQLNQAANAGKMTQIEALLTELENTDAIAERVQMYNIALKGVSKAFSMSSRNQNSGDRRGNYVSSADQDYNSTQLVQQAENLFQRLLQNGETPSSYTYSALIQCCIEANRYDLAEKWFEEYRKNLEIFGSGNNPPSENAPAKGNDGREVKSSESGAERGGSAAEGGAATSDATTTTSPAQDIDDHEVIYSSMMNAAFKAHKSLEAEKYFRLLTEDCDIRPSLVSYGTMLYGFARRCDNWGKAMEYLDLMQSQNIQPNAVIYTSLISYCAKRNDWQNAEKWMEEMCEKNVLPDSWAYNALLTVLIRHEQTDRALFYLDKALTGEHKKHVKKKELRIDGLLRLVCSNAAGEAASVENYPVETIEKVFDAVLHAQHPIEVISFNLAIAAMWARNAEEKAMFYFEKLKNWNLKSGSARQLEPTTYTHFAMMRGAQSQMKGEFAINYYEKYVKESEKDCSKLENLYLRLLLESEKESDQEKAQKHRKSMEDRMIEFDNLSKRALGVEKESVVQQTTSDDGTTTTQFIDEGTVKNSQIFTNTVVNSRQKVLNKAKENSGGSNGIVFGSNKVVDWEATVNNSSTTSNDESGAAAGSDTETSTSSAEQSSSTIVFKNVNTGVTTTEQPAFGWVKVMDSRYGEDPYYWDVQSNRTQWTPP
ncbi:unnamed protein product [Amoebophrya sp. A120]|nr:unnamed protein product [Amoebophrya sp. A120]|eukprot:GSA120T00009244001.1